MSIIELIENKGMQSLVLIFGTTAFVVWYMLRTRFAVCESRELLTQLFVIEIVIIGTSFGGYAFTGNWALPIFAITATGISTFYGILLYSFSRSNDLKVGGSHIRPAIAAGLTTMYLVLVGFGVFIVKTDKSQEMDELARHLITSFSSVIGVVIAFYFGSEAFIESRQQDTSPSRETPGNNT